MLLDLTQGFNLRTDNEIGWLFTNLLGKCCSCAIDLNLNRFIVLNDVQIEEVLQGPHLAEMFHTSTSRFKVISTQSISDLQNEFCNGLNHQGSTIGVEL